MKAATINELKQELSTVPIAELRELCLRLAKFKKENKELLTYLLFEAVDEEAYINNVKKEIEETFKQVHPTQLYLSKKTIRKILRICNKYIRYTGSKPTEIEILVCFCFNMKKSGIPFQNSVALVNLYNSQVKKIRAAISTLHDDLQYDYSKLVAQLDDR
jgi:hypothetical protein